MTDLLCPHSEPILVQNRPFSADKILEVLGPMITPERLRRIDEVLSERTYSVTPVTEGLYDRGNVSAVLRSAEALGYQAVQVIDTCKKFKKAKRVTQGADKWLDMEIWGDTASCVARLKSLGYRIIATDFENAKPIGEVPFDTPAALFFGNEKVGLSNELLAAADERIVVPMTGFTPSFNISVAAALCLYHIREDRVRRLGSHGDLNPETARKLRAVFYLKSVVNGERILLEHG